ncbi:MAG: archaetidylserine decarboxylase [Gammaproteobacteria bacterium]|nr:archaetidylserine decarboxylase [Gammaproteobacteria bacterium]
MSRRFAALQRLLPQHGLSRLVGRFACSQTPWIRRTFIQTFAAAYGVDLREAARSSPDDYNSFNDFFTRELRSDARPITTDPLAVSCPADGSISQIGPITHDKLMQAKGTSYSLRSLTGADLPQFNGGTFATVYLAPKDYHRVHLPIGARLIRTTAIPGGLFSVNAKTEASISDLFCRNERLVCHFESGHGDMLVVLVGALIVASIETVWSGPRSPYQSLTVTDYALRFERGSEIGRFLLGSTVIVCFESGRVELDGSLRRGSKVRVGQLMGHLIG